MAIDFGMHREEICDLFLVQHKPLKQVKSLMQERYGLKASYVLELL
jgi:hypothetical protein